MIDEKQIMSDATEYFKGNELAANVWYTKYRSEGEINPEQTLRRVATGIAKQLKTNYSKLTKDEYDKKRDFLTKQYRDIHDELFYENVEYITNWLLDNYIAYDKIIPGGSGLYGIGNMGDFSSISNCFVLGQPHDSYAGINQKSDEITEVEKCRGGAGLDLSTIRPRGAVVKNQSKVSSGPCLFMDRYSNITREVAQDGRRGALMLTIDIKHPDSLEFIEKKQVDNVCTGANTSVKCCDEFMKVVTDENHNGDFLLRFPVDIKIDNIDLSALEYNALTKIGEKQYVKKVNAKHYWKRLNECAHKTAEPGVIFNGNWETYGLDYPYEQFRPISTNPCVSADTLILTDTGYREIVSCVGEKVNIWNGDEWSEVEPRITGENQQMYKVTLSDGRFLRCTGYHEWLFYWNGSHEYFNKIKTIDIDSFSDILPGNRKLMVCDFNLPINFIRIYTDDFPKQTNVTVVSVVPDGIDEKVYCFNEPKKHRGTFNGIMTGQCSELPMPPYDSCRLTAYNLYDIVDEPFTEFSSINEKQLAINCYVQQIICDAIVDLELQHIDNIIKKNKNPGEPEELVQPVVRLWENIKSITERGRRTGCGFIGVADMLASLGKPYTAISTLDYVFKEKLRGELQATTDLSILFGSFDGFNIELELSVPNKFYEMLRDDFIEEFTCMIKHGRRNVSLSTGAPTGSISILSQTTSGIEPLFKPYYIRRKKCMVETDRVDFTDTDGERFTEYLVIHPKIKTWAVASGKYDNIESLSSKEFDEIFAYSPWLFNCAEDLTINDRLNVQTVVQKYTTHAISSTINLPSDVAVETIKKCYEDSWKRGLKGNTVYREGSRGGILVNVNEGKNSKQEIKGKTKRPISVDAHYYMISTRDEDYGVIIGLNDGKPFEIFIISGINLPFSVDSMEPINGSIVKEFSDWYVFYSEAFTIKDLCEVQHDEKLISLMLSGLLRSGMEPHDAAKTIIKSKPIAGTFAHKLAKTISIYSNGVHTGEKCSQCGGTVVYEDGCHICKNCGHSDKC